VPLETAGFILADVQSRAVHGNGNPRGNGIPMGIPWEWEYVWAVDGNGNGNTVTGMGMAYFSIRYVKKFPLLVTPNVSRELTSFLTQQHAVTDEEEN